MVKIIFQSTAHRVLKRVYGCEHVLHCRWNIWFSLARPRPVTHSAGLMQSVYPIVTLTIHLWPTAGQYQEPNKLSLKHYWMIFLCVSRTCSDLPCDNCFKRYDCSWGFNKCNADLASHRFEQMIKDPCKTNILQGQHNIIHSAQYSCFSIALSQWCHQQLSHRSLNILHLLKKNKHQVVQWFFPLVWFIVLR